MDHYNEISQYNVHLNWGEKAWAAWYAYMQNDVLATGIMSFVMHEVIYFGRCIPFMIMDRIPYFQKYKIQGVSLYCPPPLQAYLNPLPPVTIVSGSMVYIANNPFSTKCQP